MAYTKNINTRIRTRKDTEANWLAANPILRDGEEIIVSKPQEGSFTNFQLTLNGLANATSNGVSFTLSKYNDVTVSGTASSSAEAYYLAYNSASESNEAIAEYLSEPRSYNIWGACGDVNIRVDVRNSDDSIDKRVTDIGNGASFEISSGQTFEIALVVPKGMTVSDEVIQVNTSSNTPLCSYTRMVGDGITPYNMLTNQYYGALPAYKANINGKNLMDDITLTASDVGAASATHTHDDLVKINDVIIPDCGSWPRKFYNSKTDNAFWAYDKRYNVTGVMYNSEGTVTNNNVWVTPLFDGKYDSPLVLIPAGSKLVITINYGYALTYPYGEIYYTFYYGKKPKSLVCIQKTKENGEIVDRTLYTSSVTNSMWKSSNPGYWPWATGYEITIQAPDDRECSIAEMEMYNSRTGGMSVVSKTSEQTLVYPLYAPRFVGKLQGNADTATNATHDGDGLKFSDYYLKKSNLAATEDELSARTSTTTAITPSNLNNAVKAALTDSKAISGLTENEKQTARNIIGAISSSDIPKGNVIRISTSDDTADYHLTETDSSGYFKLNTDTFDIVDVMQIASEIGATVYLENAEYTYTKCLYLTSGVKLVGLEGTAGERPVIHLHATATVNTGIRIGEFSEISNIMLIGDTQMSPKIAGPSKITDVVFDYEYGVDVANTGAISTNFSSHVFEFACKIDICRCDFFNFRLNIGVNASPGHISIHDCEFTTNVDNADYIYFANSSSNQWLYANIYNNAFDVPIGNELPSPISIARTTGSSFINMFSNVVHYMPSNSKIYETTGQSSRRYINEFGTNFQTTNASAPKYGEIITGTYIGDGTTIRTINLGFKPKWVIVWPRTSLYSNGKSEFYRYCGLAVTSAGQRIEIDNSSAISMDIVDSGFEVRYNASYCRTNVNGDLYKYIAQA